MDTMGNTDFAAVSAVCSLLSGLTVPYWIAGGWAIDLAVGRVTRDHADVDVMLLERDKPDSMGGRKVMVAYDAISAVKITDVIELPRFQAMGFQPPL